MYVQHQQCEKLIQFKLLAFASLPLKSNIVCAKIYLDEFQQLIQVPSRKRGKQHQFEEVNAVKYLNCMRHKFCNIQYVKESKKGAEK